MGNLKRTFIGVPIKLAPDFVAFLKYMQKEFENERIRWVPERNMHLTLAFIGPTPDDLEALVQKAILKTY